MKCVIASCVPFMQNGQPLAPDDILLAAALRAQGIEAEIIPCLPGVFDDTAIVKIGSTTHMCVFRRTAL